MRDVLSLWRSLGTSGMAGHSALATLLPTDPPHHLWMGLQHYAFIVAKVREDLAELKKEQEAAHAD